jgi:hypothetical protein
MCPHLAVALEAQAVGPAFDLSHVADRTTADTVSQFEDLRQGQHRSFCGLFSVSAFDPARIAGDDPVVLSSGQREDVKQTLEYAAASTNVHFYRLREPA